MKCSGRLRWRYPRAAAAPSTPVMSPIAVRTTTKKNLKAGTHTITIPLTAAGRAAKKHRTKLKIQASETLAGLTGTATTTLKA